MAKAVFGFGHTDNEAISRAIKFPLFVCDPSRSRSQFAYLGNYVAIKLGPVVWEQLSEEVCFFIFSYTRLLGQGSAGI